MSRRLSEIPTKARFATYCLLSLTSVATFQGKPSKDSIIAVQLLWATIPFIATAIFHIIYDFVNGRCIKCTEARVPQFYAATVSMVLVIVGQFATWTQSYLAVATTTMDPDTNAQARVIHFAMSFYILSECEFYRLYWITHRRERPFNLKSLFDTIYEADNDRNFEESRDCISYHFTIPHLKFPPRDGWMSRQTFKRYLVDPLCTAFYHLVAMACLNYPIKRLANPDPEGDSFPLPAQFLEVLFTPKHRIFLWLDIKLQRPIRLLNRMLFWSIVECMERAWSRWDNTDIKGRVDTRTQSTAYIMFMMFIGSFRFVEGLRELPTRGYPLRINSTVVKQSTTKGDQTHPAGTSVTA
jgi:hypothetical protein